MKQPGIRITFEVSEEDLKAALGVSEPSSLRSYLKPDYRVWGEFIEEDTEWFMDRCEIERCDVEVADAAGAVPIPETGTPTGPNQQEAA